MSAKISKKTGEVIQPRGPNHRPTFSHIRTLARVHPERLYEDERGRLYGQHDGFWFVHLPTTPAQATVDQDVEFPEEETTATLKNLKTEEELGRMNVPPPYWAASLHRLLWAKCAACCAA